jgi:sarcosine oxidase/L-pipecolate oxidase
MHRHSFKLLPNIGKHIVELIEGTLSEELANAWRWRPGGDALKSRRAAPAKDLADMPGWNHDQDNDSRVDSLAKSLDSVRIRSQL